MLEVALSFFAGVATAIGTYAAFRQFRRSEPLIDLVVVKGITVMSPKDRKEGYDARFDFGLLNRKDIPYALFDIEWRPRARRLRRRLGPVYRHWIDLRFREVWTVPDLAYRQPLMMKPYEYREITGYWWNFWVDDSSTDTATAYWREHPDDEETWRGLLSAVLTKEVEFRLRFADGAQRKYYFGAPNRRLKLSAWLRRLRIASEDKWPRRSI